VDVEQRVDERNLYGRATRLRDDTPLALGTVWREIEAREAAEAAGMNGHQPAAVLIGAGPTKASED